MNQERTGDEHNVNHGQHDNQHNHAHSKDHTPNNHSPKPKPTNTSAQSKQDTKGITIKKADDMATWYGQVVRVLS